MHVNLDNWTNHISVAAGGRNRVGSGDFGDEDDLDYVERSFLVKIPAVDLCGKQLKVDQHVFMGLYRYVQDSKSHAFVEQAWGHKPECEHIDITSPAALGSLVLTNIQQ